MLRLPAGLLATACAATLLAADDPGTGPGPKPSAAGTACHGTAVEFVATPAEAARLAARQKKLVLVLHVSGHFEDPTFTWNNAEALRVGALADEKVGKFVNRYFVASFQRVGSFQIAGGQKQGGNVATYFCAPDGRVLHAVAGPVDAKAFLEEARWAVEKTSEAVKASKGEAARFKALVRKAHADRLEGKYGVQVTPVLTDGAMQSLATASAYRDSGGRRLAPVLPLPPVESASDRRRPAGTPAQVHRLLAGHAGRKIEDIYGAVFEGILGEKVTTKPVEADRPFSGPSK